MYYKKNLLFSIIFMYLIIYSPSFILADKYIVISKIFIILSFIISFFIIMKNMRIFTSNNSSVSYLFMLLTIFLIYICFNYIIFQDNYYLKAVVYLYMFFFIALIFYKRLNKTYFFDIIFYLTVFDASIVLLMAYSDDFRVLVQSFQRSTLLLEVSGNIRFVSLNGMSGSLLSVFYFIGAISFFYMTSKNKFRIFGLFLIILAFFYTGRTGLLFLIIAFTYYLFKYISQKTNIFLVATFIVLLFIFGYMILYNFYYLIYMLPVEYQNTLRFVLYLFDDNVQVFTPLVLLESMSVIENLNNIFFGDFGFHGYDLGLYHSDVGYIKMMFTIGFIGQFLIVLFYALFLIYSIHYIKYERKFEFLIILIILGIYVFHFKGLYIIEGKLAFLIFLTYFILEKNAIIKRKIKRLIYE